jgi:carboxymethylenebutenolidase
MGKQIVLRAADGFELEAYRADPEGSPRAAIVVVQEIFGVNAHIRSVCDAYAAQGLVAIAPAIFDRSERGVELGYDGLSVARGGRLARRLQPEQTLADLQAAIDYGAGAASGAVVLVGYCFGGSMAWLAACECRGLSAAASYYGSHVVRFVDRTPRVPIILHFGERDSLIPLADVETIRRAHPDLPIHVYPAEHGFSCDARASYDAAAAKLALDRTLAHFAANSGSG